MPKLWLASLMAGAALIGVLCFAWPATAALAEVLATSDFSRAALDGRRLVLLARGLAVALAAAALAQLLGAGLACGLNSGADRWLRAGAAWVGLVVLLTPPYLYAYAWTLPLPGGVAFGPAAAPDWSGRLLRAGRAAWCLGSWTAPVAAAVISCGWRAAGQPAYRLALLDASRFQALRRAALVLMLPWVLLSLTATGALALTEYSVCHLGLVQTWNTEVLAEVQLFGAAGGALRPGDALLLAWPLLAIVGVAVAAWWPYRGVLRRVLDELSGFGVRVAEAAGAGGAARWWPGRAAAALAVLVLLFPWVIFVASLREPAALIRTWRVYPREWPDGLLCAAGSVLAGLWLALGVDYVLARPRGAGGRGQRVAGLLGRLVLLAAAVAAAAPPALVGDAFLAAYARLPAIIDHWPVLSLVTTARFALLALVVVQVAGRLGSRELHGPAATDGAGWPETFLRLRLPLLAPALLSAGVVVGLLSFTELAASSLVRPPGVDTVALTLLNALHYGRDDDVIAMSLYLMLFVALVAGTAGWAWSRLAARRR